MPHDVRKRVAVLTGAVSIDEVDQLAAWVRGAGRNPRVDLQNCSHVHTAVLQLLAAAGTVVSSPPPDPVLATLVSHLLPTAPAVRRPAAPRPEKLEMT